MKIDYKAISDYGISVAFNNADSLLPEVRTHFIESGDYGSINYGTSFGNREFEFKCYIKGSEIPQKMNEFIRQFYDKKGHSKEVRLELDSFQNKYFTVTLSSAIKLNYLSEGLAEFTLSLASTYPFARGIYNVESYNEAMTGLEGGFEIPINYYGTYPTEFEVSFFGKLSYFDIEVHKGDGSIDVFHYISASHDTFMKIDFRNFVIDDNGNNGLPNATGKFLQLDQDATKLVFRGDIVGSLTVSYQEVYI